MNVSTSYWWEINIDAGNGLVPSGIKPLPDSVLGLCHRMTSLGHSELEAPLMLNSSKDAGIKIMILSLLAIEVYEHVHNSSPDYLIRNVHNEKLSISLSL